MIRISLYISLITNLIGVLFFGLWLSQISPYFVELEFRGLSVMMCHFYDVIPEDYVCYSQCFLIVNMMMTTFTRGFAVLGHSAKEGNEMVLLDVDCEDI